MIRMPSAATTIALVALLVASTGTAVASGLITGADVKSGSLASIDVKNHSLLPVDLGGRSGSLRRPKFSALANVKAKQLGVRLPNWRSGLERYVPWLLEKGRPAP